jgi:conjugative transfer region lipoprotein (TIGR03751 family)
METTKILILIGTSLTLLLGGCATKDAMIPQPEQTMQDVYYGSMGAVSQGKLLDERSALRRAITESDVDLSQYVRTEANQLQSKFKLLPNPTLYMFVAPHLSTADGVPVPGYLTEFKLYTKEHYAMPGEIYGQQQ